MREDFCCEVNGKKWWPSKNGDFKAKDLQVLMDSDGKYLSISAYNSTSSVLIGIKDTTSLIQVGLYNLTGQLPGRASYSSGAGPGNLYETDSLHTGIVTITQLDRNKSINIVAGTFSFKAQHPATGAVVDVAKGTFRTEYIRY